MSTTARKHYIVGSGSYGCLYDNGPHAHERLADAVADLADTFELGRVRRKELKDNHYLDLDSSLSPIERNEGKSFGADYCEITECSCATPWQHNEDDSPENWPGYADEACTCPQMWNGHGEPKPDPTRIDTDCPVHGKDATA